MSKRLYVNPYVELEKHVKAIIYIAARYAGIFLGGGQNLQNSRYKVALFLFSDAKITYSGKYRLTLICSIVADGGRRLKPQKYVLGSGYVHSDLEPGINPLYPTEREILG